jgi:predicted ATPase
MVIRIGVEQGSRIFMMCPLLLGWTLMEVGKVTEGLERMREAVASKRLRGFRFYYDYELLVFAEALLKVGELAHAKGIIAEALEFIATSGNRLFEAEARRLEGAWLAASSGGLTRAAEDCLQAAIATAEQQGTISFALRAATSLVRSCDSEDRRRAALGVLARVYGRFSEGLETADLQDARALLRSTKSTQGLE